jgi:hypothetical protein
LKHDEKMRGAARP